MKLSELIEDQKGHLAWRLDAKTSCGYITACSVARGSHGDLDIVDIFVRYGDVSRRSALYHAKKVASFVLSAPNKALQADACRQCGLPPVPHALYCHVCGTRR